VCCLEHNIKTNNKKQIFDGSSLGKCRDCVLYRLYRLYLDINKEYMVVINLDTLELICSIVIV